MKQSKSENPKPLQVDNANALIEAHPASQLPTH